MMSYVAMNLAIVSSPYVMLRIGKKEWIEEVALIKEFFRRRLRGRIISIGD